MAALFDGLQATHVGFCLTGPDDWIRYVNETFRRTFMPQYEGEGGDFITTLAAAIAMGQGIRLQTMTPADFVTRYQKRRRELRARNDFSVDCVDGSWWWINDHQMADGSILVVASDMSPIKHQELALRHAHAAALRDASTDFLTGLPNRRAGFDHAERTLEAARGAALAVAVVDIDHFKRINDTYGHEIGDKVLVHFAQSLRQELRGRDQISRIGGEEFLVIMPEFDVEAARFALSRALEAISTLTIGPRGAVLPITASAGVTTAREAVTFRQLLGEADAALYLAKSSGRHRVEACPL